MWTVIEAKLGEASTQQGSCSAGRGPPSLPRGCFPNPMAPILTMHALQATHAQQRKDKETPKNEALLPC